MPQPLQQHFSPSPNCVKLIQGFEGYTATAKHDSADRPGIYTGGWGSITHKDGSPIEDGETHDKAYWQDLLEWELSLKATSVNALLQSTPITQQQFDALISFAYNEGIGNLRDSTLLRKVKNNPLDASIYLYTLDPNTGYGKPGSCEFLKWTLSNGKRQPGLVRRRTAEAHLYETGDLQFFDN